jgi:uncharacterized damage-inducible protein DinB
MDMIKSLTNELTAEAASSRKMLALVPMNAAAYKPHERSMTMGRLASHLAELPGRVAMILHTSELDFASGDVKPFHATSNEALLKHHDANVAKALQALAATNEEELLKNWTLRRGDHIIFTMPKIAVIRNMAINHFIHHRGQLSVYMRLNNVPLPSIYGPTAPMSIYH